MRPAGAGVWARGRGKESRVATLASRSLCAAGSRLFFLSLYAVSTATLRRYDALDAPLDSLVDYL